MRNKLLRRFTKSYAYKNYSQIWRYVEPYKGRALIAVLVTIPCGAMDAAIPWALKQYMDAIGTKNISFLVQIMPFLIAGFSLVQSAFIYLSTYMNTWVGTKISHGLKYDLFKKLLRCDAEYFNHSDSGLIQMKFNSDADMACLGLLNNFKMFAIRLFNSLSLLVALLVISWRLAIVAIIVLLAALYPVTTIRKRIADLAHQAFTSGGMIASNYLEAFGGNRIISSYNLYEYQLRKFIHTLKIAFSINMKMTQRTGILSPIMHFIVGCGIALIIFSGNYLISCNLLTAGGFVAFTASVIMLYQPIKSIGNDLNSVQLSLLAMERVFALLKEKPLIQNKSHAKKLTKITQSIEYQDVSFLYESEKPVLQNVNLKINAGETVAFVGNSGGGKTTLVNLLPRFYDVTSGAILIDGTDIRDFDIDSLRSQIAIVFQENFLFNGTIEENILLGREDATQEELDAAVRSACLENFVSSLKKGLKTSVGERGVLLSGGQKQRVAIARAFIKNAPIVVLDEATSALDNKSESIVQQAIDNLMKDRTVFIIAHRLSTVRNADKIVVVNNGRIAEIGSHAELIKRPEGVYSSLYRMQV